MPTNNESNTSPRKVHAIVKQARALDLRVQGLTLQEIADELGYSSHGGVHYAIQKALENITYESVGDFRKLTLERLTRILKIHWPSVENGDMASARLALDIIKNMREVTGVDVPSTSKVEHSGPEGAPIQHEVMTLDVSEVAEALNTLAEAGAVRLEADAGESGTIVDAVYPPQTYD
mgnify:CR=1 FL=1